MLKGRLGMRKRGAWAQNQKRRKAEPHTGPLSPWERLDQAIIEHSQKTGKSVE